MLGRKGPGRGTILPRITLAEGHHPNDHLVVELVDGQETPQVGLVHWPVDERHPLLSG